MTVVVSTVAPGFTADMFEAISGKAQPGGQLPEGCQVQIAGPVEQGWRVITVWESREAFDRFVGGTFYRQMLGAMQKTVNKPAYFHGGQAEEMFRGQLNEILADKMAEATADQFTGPMFELFQLSRQ